MGTDYKYLLKEDGGYLLQEDGYKIILEQVDSPSSIKKKIRATGLGDGGINAK